MTLPDYLQFIESNAQDLMEVQPNAAKEMLRLVRIIKVQGEALEFYGDTENYDKTEGAVLDMQPRGLHRKLYSVLDFGDRSRTALAETERIVNEVEK